MKYLRVYITIVLKIKLYKGIAKIIVKESQNLYTHLSIKIKISAPYVYLIQITR